MDTKKFLQGGTPLSAPLPKASRPSLDSPETSTEKGLTVPVRGVEEESNLAAATPLGVTTSNIKESIQKLQLTMPRLSGAARRRYRWLVKNGHDPSEARKLALVPIGPPPAVKRARLSDSTPGGVPKKPRTGGSDGSASAHASSSPTLNTIRIGIVSKDYPQEILTMEQLKAIQEGILGRIVELVGGTTQPKFHGSILKPGWVQFNCDDEATAEWLKLVVGQLKPWEGADLRTVEGDEIPRPIVLTGLFQNSARDGNDKILTFVKAQNLGLNTDEWRVLKREERGDSVHLVLSLDQHSETKLRAQNHLLSYKFGTVGLRKRSGKPEGGSRLPTSGGTASPEDYIPKEKGETLALKEKVTPSGSQPKKKIQTAKSGKEGQTKSALARGSSQNPKPKSA